MAPVAPTQPLASPCPPNAATDSILVMFKTGIDRQQRLLSIQRAGRDLRFKHIAGGRLAKVMVPQGVDRDTLLKKRWPLPRPLYHH